MVATHEEGGVDWRRLASDRNVKHDVARGLWEKARATAPHDPKQAETAFKHLLEEAAAGNATHEPGRETLVDAKGPRDAGSLGPGKWTRVLEEQKPGGPAGSAKPKGPEAAAPGAHAAGGAQPQGADGKAPTKSPKDLHKDLVAAVQASKDAVQLITSSDPATIVEALRELKEHEGPAVLQKIMSVAGSAIERLLGKHLPDPHAHEGPVGEKVQFSVGDETHTQYVDEDGVPMMASKPTPVTKKVEDFKKAAASQPPAVQAKVTPAVAQATTLAATATDQAKKAKAGDAAAKAALPKTQQQLAATLGTASHQVGAEPDTKPKLPPPTTTAAPTATPTAPKTAAGPTAKPDPAAPKLPPDPLAIKAADLLLHKHFHLLGGKLPAALAALSDQERVDQSGHPAADLRQQHFATFDSLKPVMSAGAQEKANQLDHELGLEKGNEGLIPKFKTELLAAFHADTHTKATTFESLFNEVAKTGYMMKGQRLTPAQFNAAVPAEHSLARVINTGGAFAKYLNKGAAEPAWQKAHPKETPTTDAVMAWALEQAKINAADAIPKYILPTIVEYTSWLFPEPDIKHDAAFSEYCDLLALYANWYPQGHLRMVVRRDAVTAKIGKDDGLRKPTVFDGTLSPLWMQRDNRDHAWGKTGGGLREALMKVDWADIDHTKWVLVQIDPKYQAVLDAQKAKNAKTATPADATTIADHEKTMVDKTVAAQGAQRVDDHAHAGADKPVVATEKTAAPPIEVPTSMAGTAHTLKADPAVGKIEFHSIAGWAVQKLQSVVDLVPQEVKTKAAAALAKAVEATALVIDPSLKPGAETAHRAPVVHKLGDHLKELAIAIRVFGDSGKITDADPGVVQQIRVDEEMKLRRLGQGQNKPKGSEGSGQQAAGTASKPVEASPGSAAANAKANAAGAATAAPEAGGFQKNDQKNAPGDKKGRTADQTAAVATADPQFGGKADADGKGTETVAGAVKRLHPDEERDSNFNPKAKVAFETALAAEILASPHIYSPQVFEISGKILAYVDVKAKAGVASALTQLAALKTTPNWFGHVKEVANATEEQIGEGIRHALRGKGNIPQHLAVHQMFLSEVLLHDWSSDICKSFVGEAAVDPAFVRGQVKMANGELNADGVPVFEDAHASERGRVNRPAVGAPIGAAAGPTPKNDNGSDPAPLLDDHKTHAGTDAGTKQDINRGIDIFTMNEAKAFVQRARLKVNMPLIAGISGSTAELINCAMSLGLHGESLHRYALAVIGYIGGGGNHSFIEIVTVLKAAGLPVNPDSYEGFYPAVFAAHFQSLKKLHPQAFHDAPKASSTPSHV